MGWEALRTKSFKAGEIPGKGRMTASESWRLDANAPRRAPKQLEAGLTALWRKIQAKLGLK